ncbi:transposase [Micromonospora sp. L32]|uniref:transposase n=1 Tax=Micromonospora TaxID=1873 RepID=UPI003F8979DD
MGCGSASSRCCPNLSAIHGTRDASGSRTGRCCAGSLFVLHTGIQWEFLPQQLGFGSGVTCWRRREEWNRPGVWQRLHEVLLAELHGAGKVYWSRAVIESSHVRAAGRGTLASPSMANLPRQEVARSAAGSRLRAGRRPPPDVGSQDLRDRSVSGRGGHVRLDDLRFRVAV